MTDDSVVQESASVSLQVLRQTHCLLSFRGPFPALALDRNTVLTCAQWHPEGASAPLGRLSSAACRVGYCFCASAA